MPDPIDFGEAEAARRELLALVQKYAREDTPGAVLAVAAYLVGQLIAMQNQRTVTPEMAMRTVLANIELGNQHVIAELVSAPGGRA